MGPRDEVAGFRSSGRGFLCSVGPEVQGRMQVHFTRQCWSGVGVDFKAIFLVTAKGFSRTGRGKI